MATRVNTKFVALLVAVMVALSAGALGFWFFVVQDDPEQLIAQADVHMQEGEVRAAVEKYQKAVSDRQDDVDLIMTTVDAMQQLPVQDIVEARQVHGKIISWTRQASDLAPQNDQLLKRFYTMLLGEARRIGGGGGAFRRMLSHADNRLQSDPDNVIVRKFRGIAQTHQLNADSPREEWEQAREDLQFVLDQDGDDAEALYHLAIWHLSWAQRLQQMNASPEDIEKQRNEALAVSKRMLEADPEDADRLMKRIRVLVQQPLNRLEQAKPLMGRLAKQLKNEPGPPHRVMRFVELLRRLQQQQPETTIGGQSPMAHGRQLLQRAIEANPNAVSYHVALGQMMRQQGELEPAIKAYSRAREISLGDEVERTADELLRGKSMERLAARDLAQTLLAQAAQTSEAEAKSKLFDRAETLIESLRQQAGGATGTINRLLGQLALQRGNAVKAAKHLDRALNQLSGSNPRVARLAAEAYLQQDAWGAAADRLERLSADYQQATSLRIRLAQIYLENNQPEKARTHIQTVLQQEPDNRQARQLKAQMLAMRGDTQEAIELYEQFPPEQRGQMYGQLAQLYVRAGQVEQARQLVEARLDQAPGDLRAVRLMMQLAQDKDQKQAVLAQAEEAGANAQVIDVLRSLVEAEGQSPEQQQAVQQQLVDRLVAQQDDPVSKALIRARIQVQRGNVDQARQIVEKAAETAPDNEQLIRLQFEMALSQENFEQARELSSRAEALNLDQAQGEFFRGRVFLAQGQADQAVAAFKRGVSARPVYSQGQRLLGDALREQGNLEQAVEAYEEAVSQQPDNVQARQKLAQVQLQLDRGQAALQQLRAAREYAPNDAQLRERYLRVERQYGDATRALEQRQAIAEAQPENLTNRRQLVSLLSQLDRHEQALERAQALANREDRNRSDVVALAQAYRTAGQPEQGASALRSYIQSLDEQAQAQDYMVLARYQLLRGQGEAALQAYQQAMEREDPATSIASRELAQLFFMRGLNERAAELYNELYQRSDNNVQFGQRWVESLIRAGQLEKAQQALSEMPDGATTQALQAMIAMRRGETERASELFTRSIENDREQPFVLFQRGKLRAGNDEVDQAISDMQQAVQMNPGLHPARFQLAQLHLRQGNLQTAIGELRTLLQRNPGHQQGRLRLISLQLAQDNPEQAQSLLEDAREQFPQQAIWARRLAQMAASRGEAQQALGHWRDAVSISPSPQNLMGLSQLLIATDQAPQVESVLTERADLLNRVPRLQGMRGRALAETGKPDAALNVFRRALQRSIDADTALFIAEQMRQSLGVDQTRTEIASVKSKMQPPALAMLVQARLAAGAGDNGPAIETLRKLLQQINREQHADLWVRAQRMLGQSLQRAGEYAAAREAYEQVLAAQNNDVSVLNNLAYMLATQTDQTQRALDYARRAVQQNPANAQILDTLGWVQYKAGQLQQAQVTLQRSVALRPFAYNHLHLGRVLMDLGNLTRARTMLQDAARLASETNQQDVSEQANAWLSEMSSS
jgi:tetratricopeptide (TPR) repeat protein